MAEVQDKLRQLELGLAAAQRVLGPDHPNTLAAMNNLAATLSDQGELNRARELQEQVLHTAQRLLGPDHPNTLAAMNNLAATLSDQGELNRARELQEQVLHARQRILGPDDPDTLAAMNNLAYTLQALGDLPRARELQQQALNASRNALGPEHPYTLAAMNNLAYTLQALGDLPRARELQQQATTLDRLHRATTGRPLVANLPPRNPAFTGRAELLDQLAARLHPGLAAAVVQAQAIHGLDGVGKTQLALEYAHRHAGDYDLIWWVTAEQPAAIPGQLVALARRLGIPEAVDQMEIIAVLYNELRGRDRWLLVFDNAEDPADLRPWWPPDSGHVLVTSRNPAWASVASTLLVEVLPRAEAIAFLKRRLGREDPAFDQLAAVLGDLPLALEQAAAYLEQIGMSVSDYLDLFSERTHELLALGRLAMTERAIATTWTVALQRLHQEQPAAEDLLSLCAFLAADDIPRGLPTQHPEVLPERLASAVQDPWGYRQAIAALHRYSLVATRKDRETLSVHRLVQAVIRSQLEPEQERSWAAAALALVRAAFPARLGDPDAWPVYARLLPHALAVADYAEALDIQSEPATWLLREAGLYLWQRADYSQARVLHERAVALDEARLGSDHPTTATSLTNLANVLRDQGDLQGAGTLHQRALAIREARLGADHPDTARSLDNLAGVLHLQGDLQGARTLYERALAISEARLGTDHPDTARSLSNLAGVLHLQGDLDRARALHERALTIREARLGPDHPDTVRSRQNLAAVVAALDKQQ
jgi:tetratricopeptide (TPR) repeat protein